MWRINNGSMLKQIMNNNNIIVVIMMIMIVDMFKDQAQVSYLLVSCLTKNM